MLKKYFVAGTDTGVGKTLASAIIAVAIGADYWKPIQSGIADEISEQEKIKQLTHIDNKKILASVYSLKASLSPDQAAKLENITIDMKKCVLPDTDNHLIVEGAGGVMVPLNEHDCLIDLMEKLQLSVIVVARGTLGTINHTLLTLEALRKRNLPVHGVVFSGNLNKDSQRAIEKWGNVNTLFHIPHFDTLDQATITHWLTHNKNRIREVLL